MSAVVCPAHAVEIVGVSEAERAIYPNMIGYNSDYYYMNDPWSSDTRRAAALQTRPGMLRYPGGTSSSYWDAYNSRIFHDVEALDPADGNPAAWTQTRYTINWVHNAFFWTNTTPLSDFKRLHSALQKNDATETIFVANMVTPGADFYDLKLKRTLDRTPGGDDWWQMLGTRYGAFDYMLKDATKNGVPVKYVELGNEYYFGAGLTHRGAPADVEPYVAGSYDADNKFAWENVGTFPDKNGEQNVLYLYSVAANDWASRVKKDYPQAKVCAIGDFVQVDGQAERAAHWNEQALAALDPAKVDALSLHFYGGPQVGSLTENEEKLGAALTSWQQFWRAGIERSKLPPQYDLWITEFNIDDEFGQSDKLPESKGSWGNGLGNIYALHYWMAKEPRVKVALLHELARVIVKDGPEIKANGRAYGLFASAANGCTRARALKLQNVPALQGATEIESVVGWKFDAPDTQQKAKYVLVNFSGIAQKLSGSKNLGAMTGATYRQAASALATLDDPGETSGDVNDELLLKPYSVTVIETK